ncbi:MAG TPA: sigma-70 family RNA polymerase sigma factor [Solirubrobacteraceae bacterium]
MALSATDEAALVARARSGERAAFEELVRRHADALFAVVVRFVGRSDEAEEIVQEAFLRAWRSIDRFEGRSQFFTWLYRIAINEAKRHSQRNATARATVSLEDAPVEDAPDWSEAPEARLAGGEARRALEHAVRALPWDYRAPLVLRDVEGLSTSDAAAIMDLSEAAFKSRLHRARLVVRRAMDRHFIEETNR